MTVRYPPAPSIPRGPTDVTPQWVEYVLATEVRSVEVTPIGTGQTGATYRLAVKNAAVSYTHLTLPTILRV